MCNKQAAGVLEQHASAQTIEQNCVRYAQAMGVDKLWLNAAGYVCRQAGAFHLDRPALLQPVAQVATPDAYNFSHAD